MEDYLERGSGLSWRLVVFLPVKDIITLPPLKSSVRNLLDTQISCLWFQCDKRTYHQCSIDVAEQHGLHVYWRSHGQRPIRFRGTGIIGAGSSLNAYAFLHF